MGVRLVEANTDQGALLQEFLSETASKIGAAHNAQQLSDLAKSLREFSKSREFSTSQRDELAAIRSRIYAKKRELASKADDPTGVSSLQPKQQIKAKEPQVRKQVISIPSSNEDSTINAPRLPQPSPIEGFKRVIMSIDGEQLARMLPKCALLLSASVLVGWFLWLQSIELYAASGFATPGLVAFGGILMVVGFAGFHAAYRSKLALLCCLYAGGYEAYFIASGTFSDEIESKVADKAVSEKVTWYQEQLDRAKMSYDRKKSRYDDPSDKMHESSWYKKKHVDRAWQTYSQAQQAMEKQQQWIRSELATFDHTGWLKILFRMGLVLLFMLLVHRLGSCVVAY